MRYGYITYVLNDIDVKISHKYMNILINNILYIHLAFE